MDYIEGITSRLVKWAEGEKPGPYSLEFFVERGCNQKCRFCDPNKNKISLDFKTAFKILKEAKGLDVKICRIVGIGEPFFKKDEMTKLMERVKQYDMFGHVITNGSLLDERIVKKLVEIEWDEIDISIHGPDAATHDYLVRLPGAFDKVVHNIRRFNYWKKKLKKDKPKLKICFTLNKVNYDKIENIVRLCEELNCNFLLRPLETDIVSGESVRKLLLLNDDEEKIVEKNIEKIKEIFKKSKIEIFLPYVDGKLITNVLPCKPEKKVNCNFKHKTFLKLNENDWNKKVEDEENITVLDSNNLVNSMCFEPWLNLTIRDYRYFGTCCKSIYPILSEKKKRKYKSLKEIWFGEYFEKMRKDSIKRNFKGFCSACCNDDTTHISQHLKMIIDQKSIN